MYICINKYMVGLIIIIKSMVFNSLKDDFIYFIYYKFIIRKDFNSEGR